MTDNKKANPHGIRRSLTNYGDRGVRRLSAPLLRTLHGLLQDMLERPIVGIAQSASGFQQLPSLRAGADRGGQARGAGRGGLPIDFPTISLGEVFLSPTSLMFRNLMAMDVEEMMRAQPMDAVVLVGGCDKTVPAQLMGAASADVPAIQLVTGPMMAVPYRGERLGACTDCRRFWAKYRAAKSSDEGIDEIEGNLATTAGTCAVMGTASTMACVAEGLGMMLPGYRGDPRRARRPHACGGELPACAPWKWSDGEVRDRPRSSPRNRSRTPCACCSRSAARPTRSSISPRSRAARGRRDLARASEPTLGRNTGPAGSQTHRQSLHAGSPCGGRLERVCCASCRICCTWTA